jgi:hypothetical protein
MLCEDEWRTIFTFLTTKEILESSKCNKTIRCSALSVIRNVNVNLHDLDLDDYVVFYCDSELNDSPIKYATQITIRNCKLEPYHIMTILQCCKQLKRMEITASDNLYGLFSNLDIYPTGDTIPSVETLYLQGFLNDDDLEQIAICLPNLKRIEYFYNCLGFTGKGLLFLDAYIEFDIQSYDNHIYGVEGHDNDKNIHIHYD